PSLNAENTFRYISGSVAYFMASPISFWLGQMSLRYTALPSLPVPSGSLDMSMLTVPAIPNATTSGGLIRKVALIGWWIRAWKLRLPDSTAAATRSFLLTVSSILLSIGPEFPIHVVHP